MNIRSLDASLFYASCILRHQIGIQLFSGGVTFWHQLRRFPFNENVQQTHQMKKNNNNFNIRYTEQIIVSWFYINFPCKLFQYEKFQTELLEAFLLVNSVNHLEILEPIQTSYTPLDGNIESVVFICYFYMKK